MTPFIQDPFVHLDENAPASDVIDTMKVVTGKQKKHVAFQGEQPAYVTRAEQMEALTGRIEAARDDFLGSGNDQVKGAQLNALVAEGVKALKFNAHHVSTFSAYHNDPSLLHDAGYEFKPHPAAKAKTNLLDLLPELDGKLGPVEGSVIIIFKNRPAKTTIELEMTYTPEDEHSWRPTGEGTYNKSRVEQRDLEPVRRVYFRARYHKEGSVGRWSPPFSIIVH